MYIHIYIHICIYSLTSLDQSAIERITRCIDQNMQYQSHFPYTLHISNRSGMNLFTSVERINKPDLIESDMRQRFLISRSHGYYIPTTYYKQFSVYHHSLQMI